MPSIKESNFIWSQTALKDFENALTCPERWKAQWVDGAIEFTETLPMKYGKYFEWLCIGATAKAEEQPVIPLTTKGEKTIAQKRIEAQASRFHDMVNPMSEAFIGYSIVETQSVLYGSVAGVPVRGVVDIIAKDIDDYPVVIDLKLTDDSTSDRTPYSWGSPPDTMDLVQQVLYQQLYFQKYGVMPKMVLMIFEHGPNELVQIWNLSIQNIRVNDMIERFKTADKIKKLYEERGWVKTPSIEECERCSLTCDKRVKLLPITKKEIIY